MDGISSIAEGIQQEFQRLLPLQRKTRRANLSLLVATMLDVRSANLMDLAAGLPAMWRAYTYDALGRMCRRRGRTGR